MDHLKASNRLANFVAGELDSESSRNLREHLKHCGDCRNWVAAFGFFKRNLSAAHPSSNDLASFALAPESLDAGLRNTWKDHLSECVCCREDVETVRKAVGGARLDEVTTESQQLEAKTGPQSPMWLSWAALVTLVVGFVALTHVGSVGRQLPVHISGKTISGNASVAARGSITVDSTVVGIGSVVVVRSGGEVSFGEGFSVDEGASLSVFADAKEASEL